MSRPDHDAAKLARLALDLEQQRNSLAGLSAMYQDARQQYSHLCLLLTSGMNRNGRAVWDDRADPADLAALSREEAAGLGVDLPTARECVALRDRMTELRRRHEALVVEIEPLARLVERLTAHAEGVM